MAYNDISHPSSSSAGDADSSFGGRPPSVENAGPLTPEQIRHSCHRFSVNSEQCYRFIACPICMQEFSCGDSALTLRCFHMFHSACAEKWFEQSGNCPVC